MKRLRAAVLPSVLSLLPLLTLLACAQQTPVPSTGAAVAPVRDSGAFVIDGDPRQPAGAPWSFRGTVDGVRYELNGVILAPGGAGPFPAVILSHGSQGSARFISNEVGRTMVTWGFVTIAVDYTHAVDVPVGAPGGRSETGASRANVLRAHMTRELLRRIPYVDNTRVAAHGHSLGAYLRVAWFAAFPRDVQVASHTGGGIRPPASRIANAPTVGEAERISVPYQLHHGSSDETVPLSWDERLASVHRAR